jgi:hypothetical protein
MFQVTAGGLSPKCSRFTYPTDICQLEPAPLARALRSEKRAWLAVPTTCTTTQANPSPRRTVVPPSGKSTVATFT